MALGVGKKSNEYADELLNINAPKTVWMALVFSLFVRLGIEPGDIGDAVMAEWQALYLNRIVSQRPKRH